MELDPVLLVGYAVSGAGKSSDLVTAAPRSLFVAEPPAIRHVARHLWGFELPDKQFADPGSFALIAKALPAIKRAGFPSVVIDDVSIVAQMTFRTLEDRGLNGFPLFKAFRREVDDLRFAARDLGISVLCNAHLGPRHIDQLTGRTILGGPKLPGQAQEDAPNLFDCVYHGVRNMSRQVGWTTEWHVNDDDDYVTKCRLDVVSIGAMPMNTGEILRARGYVMARPSGLEWMDEAVVAVANMLLKAGVDLGNRASTGVAVAQIRPMLMSTYAKHGVLSQHANWVFRDAIDRVVIRTAIASRSGANSPFGG
ncbi:MAG: hypothetical protein A2W26_03210 [Acidobacteria bacterium RBG_16_64_8]|nr:MAG: hypothetical protein A2W26_03210 [Acidobacteria bacterium RBG_16_64_8]